MAFPFDFGLSVLALDLVTQQEQHGTHRTRNHAMGRPSDRKYAIFSLNLLAEFHGFDIENRVERFIFLRNLAYATYNQHTVNKQTNRFSTNCSISHCSSVKY